METTLKNIPKKEIEKLQAARTKLDKLKDQSAGYENTLTANVAKLQTIDGKIRDTIKAGGNPAGLFLEKEALQKAISTDQTTVEFFEESIAEATAELAATTTKANELLTQAVFVELYRWEAELQKLADQIENGMHKYRTDAYQAAEALGLPGPMRLPSIRLKAYDLREAIQ